SDRIAIFSAGAIQQVATAAVLYEQPQNLFVATFIGENNTLEGTLLEVRDEHCLVEIADGKHVRGLAIDVGARGQRAALSVRLSGAGVCPLPVSKANIFTARVEERIYLGDHLRMRISLLGNSQFIVKVPTSSEHAALSTGDSLTIGWDWRDCRVF